MKENSEEYRQAMIELYRRKGGNGRDPIYLSDGLWIWANGNVEDEDEEEE